MEIENYSGCQMHDTAYLSNDSPPLREPFEN